MNSGTGKSNKLTAEKCPMCKQDLGFPALSRKDNKTLICSECGLREAMAGLRR